MTIQRIIERAIEGGWKKRWVFLGITDTGHEMLARFESMATIGKVTYSFGVASILLDPTFWQAVGRVEGWGVSTINESRMCLHCGVSNFIQPPFDSGCNHAYYPEACDVCSKKSTTWKDYMHRMIQALIDGQKIEQFIETL